MASSCVAQSPTRRDQVRAARNRAAQRLRATPARDARVVAREQESRAPATPRTSAGLVYCGYSSSPSLKDSSRLDSSLPRAPGQESHDRLDDAQRRELSAGQHEVAQGDLVVDHQVERALIDALVAAAEQREALQSLSSIGHVVGERSDPTA